jgi:hypothetical protein
MQRVSRYAAVAAVWATLAAAVAQPASAASLAGHDASAQAHSARRPTGHRVKRLKMLHIDPRRSLSSQLHNGLLGSELQNVLGEGSIASSAALTPGNPCQSGFADIVLVDPIFVNLRNNSGLGSPGIFLDATESTPTSALCVEVNAQAGASYLFDLSFNPMKAPHQLATGTVFTVLEPGGISQTDAIPFASGVGHLAFVVTAQSSGVFTVSVSSAQLPWNFVECDISTAGSNG